MPLHLLGKKSWNVYNQDNIERVRRDEAQAKAREEEEERRMQEVDAERRIKLLRGEDPGDAPVVESVEHSKRLYQTHGRDQKRRRIAGEDDTDRDMRYAKENVERTSKAVEVLKRPTSDAPLMDHTGHISLFPSEASGRKVERNAEAEAESAKKKREYEDQYTMRFSNAGGSRQGMENPWYSSTAGAAVADELPGKDVWGNEDPGRKEREMARLDANDPLAFMKKGVNQLRKAEQERKKWNEERGEELAALKAEQKEERRRRRKQRNREDDLENFKLDADPREDKHGHRRHRSHRHRHRSAPRSRSRSRERRRRHSDRGDDSRPSHYGKYSRSHSRRSQE